MAHCAPKAQSLTYQNLRTSKRLKHYMDRARALHFEHWFAVGLILVFLSLFVACLSGKVHLYLGDIADGSNRFYLLSAIAQTLATILALLVTATLVATQLAAQSFTPRVVGYRLRDPWLWGAVGIYLAGIFASLGTIAAARRALNHPIWNWWSIDLTLLLTGAGLLYLVPFTLAILRSLEPASFIRHLLANGQYGGLEDFMRRAVNEGLVRQLQMAMSMLGEHARSRLQQTVGAVSEARRFAEFGIGLGKYAAAQKDPEAIIVAMDYLTRMTVHCTDRVYRPAGDVFNESVVELQEIAEEAFGQ